VEWNEMKEFPTMFARHGLLATKMELEYRILSLFYGTIIIYLFFQKGCGALGKKKE